MATPFARVAAIVATNVLVLAAGVLAIELVFGAWRNPNALNRLHLITDRTFVFDAGALYAGASPTTTYVRDRYGLRGAYGGDPSRIDVLTVGGSTTDQRFLTEGATWQDVLAAQFSADGTPLAIANAGVDGQSTYGHIRNFDWWFPHIPGLRPKFVLFYVGVNDFHLDAGTARVDTLVGQSLVNRIKDNSALWHVVRSVRGMFAATRAKASHARVDFPALHWTTDGLQRNYAFVDPRLSAYAFRIRTLIARTRAIGAVPVFISQPVRQYRLGPSEISGVTETMRYGDRDINGVDYYHMQRRFDDTIASVCAADRAIFLDLAVEPVWEDDDFYDYAHMTPHGAAKLGRLLHEKLRPIVTAPR